MPYTSTYHAAMSCLIGLPRGSESSRRIIARALRELRHADRSKARREYLHMIFINAAHFLPRSSR